MTDIPVMEMDGQNRVAVAVAAAVAAVLTTPITIR